MDVFFDGFSAMLGIIPAILTGILAMLGMIFGSFTTD